MVWRTVRVGFIDGKQTGFTNSRGVFDRENCGMRILVAAAVLLGGLTASSGVGAQAMVPPTGMQDASKPMPMADRMNRRFPQPVRVGDLIDLPVLDDSASTLGYVEEVVRTPAGQNALIVSYSKWFGWFGWFTRPVVVPIEAIGIEGKQIVSLDMPPSEYATAPTWQGQNATVLPNDDTIRIALARN
jgi:hypothetical protein